MSKIKTNETDKLLSTSINYSQNDSMKPLTSDPTNTFKILNANQNNLRSIKNLTSSPKNPVNKTNSNKSKLVSKRTIKSFQNSVVSKKSFKEDDDNFEEISHQSFKLNEETKSIKSSKSVKTPKSKSSKSNNSKSKVSENEENSNENESQNNDEYDDEQEEIDNQVQNNEAINRKLYKREKICDTDTEDEESDNEKEVPWVILPDTSYKKFWDLLLSIVIMYCAIHSPYEIAFLENFGFSIIDIFVIIILAIDIILTFFSAYTDSEENLVKNHRKIVTRYLKGWFFIDVLAIFPFTLFIDIDKTKITKYSILPKSYRLVKCIELLRITKMNSKGNVHHVTKYFLEKLKINANIERLLFFVLLFFLMNHLCACFWFLTAKLQDMDPDCWVVRLGYVDCSNIELYIISFYWTLTTVTTVGYGDISAGTTLERVYNLFIMSFGVLLYSFAIGSLSSIVSTMDQQTEEMNQKLQILSSIKKEFNLNQGIYDKVRKVIKYDLSRNQKDKMNFLQELPNKLRIELSQIMHDKVIQNLYFFRDQPSDFFAYVAPLLKPVKFSQNDYLYKVQDMIDEMYFVAKGTVIFCLDKKYGEKEIREIKKNNNFGEIEMCLNEKLTFNIKIKSRNCELFVLKKNDFLRLSVNFKEFIENFLHKSLMKYLKFNEEKNKMIKEFETLMNKANNKNKDKEKENEDKKSKNSDKSSNHNHLIESERSKKNEEDSDSHMDDSENQNKNNLIDETSHEKSPSGNKSNRSKKSEDKSSDLSLIQLKEMKTDDGDLNGKLKKKIDKISNILEKENLNLEGIDEDPKELLKKIKLETDLNTKNELVSKLEEIMQKVFEKNPKQN